MCENLNISQIDTNETLIIKTLEELENFYNCFVKTDMFKKFRLEKLWNQKIGGIEYCYDENKNFETYDFNSLKKIYIQESLKNEIQKQKNKFLEAVNFFKKKVKNIEIYWFKEDDEKELKRERIIDKLTINIQSFNSEEKELKDDILEIELINGEVDEKKADFIKKYLKKDGSLISLLFKNVTFTKTALEIIKRALEENESLAEIQIYIKNKEKTIELLKSIKKIKHDVSIYLFDKKSKTKKRTLLEVLLNEGKKIFKPTFKTIIEISEEEKKGTKERKKLFLIKEEVSWISSDQKKFSYTSCKKIEKKTISEIICITINNSQTKSLYITIKKGSLTYKELSQIFNATAKNLNIKIFNIETDVVTPKNQTNYILEQKFVNLILEILQKRKDLELPSLHDLISSEEELERVDRAFCRKEPNPELKTKKRVVPKNTEKAKFKKGKGRKLNKPLLKQTPFPLKLERTKRGGTL